MHLTCLPWCGVELPSVEGRVWFGGFLISSVTFCAIVMRYTFSLFPYGES